MNCQNCGKEEVNFHYTSSINGNITEKHLCAECAESLGYNNRLLFKPDIYIEDALTELFGGSPNRWMFGGYGMMLPTFIIPAVGMLVPNAGINEAASACTEAPAAAKTGINTEIDEEMKRRRELNILREQMKKAAEAEDFEKAATLRDSIKKLENGEMR